MSIKITSRQREILENEINSALDDAFRAGVEEGITPVISPMTYYDGEGLPIEAKEKMIAAQPSIRGPFLSLAVALADRGYLANSAGVAKLHGALGISNPGGLTLPAPGPEYRGVIWFAPGGVGAADLILVCVKDILGTYQWRGWEFSFGDGGSPGEVARAAFLSAEKRPRKEIIYSAGVPIRVDYRDTVGGALVYQAVVGYVDDLPTTVTLERQSDNKEFVKTITYSSGQPTSTTYTEVP